MAEPIEIGGGQWIKYEQYEIREGSIAPAPGARSSVYDPWELAERPYVSLRRVVPTQDVLMLPSERPEVVKAALAWCNEYGLLGTLLNRLVAVTFAPRWKRVEFADNETHDVFAPHVDTHLHLPSGWLHETTGYSGYSRDPSDLNTPVTPELWPNGAPQPGVVLVDLPGVSTKGGVAKRLPLDGIWSDHFPDVSFRERQTYDYPAPATLDFWKLYGEPVEDFVYAAWVLSDAIEAILNPRHADARQNGLSRLSALASCASPGLEPQRDGTLRHRWIAGSLLSCLALQAMDDLAHRLLYQCARCGSLFASSSYQARYCSATCREAMQKRRHRNRKRKGPEATEVHASGEEDSRRPEKAGTHGAADDDALEDPPSRTLPPQ